MKKNSIDRRQFFKTTAGLTVLGSVALDPWKKLQAKGVGVHVSESDRKILEVSF